jgi:hypothetical protein
MGVGMGSVCGRGGGRGSLRERGCREGPTCSENSCPRRSTSLSSSAAGPRAFTSSPTFSPSSACHAHSAPPASARPSAPALSAQPSLASSASSEKAARRLAGASCRGVFSVSSSASSPSLYSPSLPSSTLPSSTLASSTLASLTFSQALERRLAGEACEGPGVRGGGAGESVSLSGGLTALPPLDLSRRAIGLQAIKTAGDQAAVLIAESPQPAGGAGAGADGGAKKHSSRRLSAHIRMLESLQSSTRWIPRRRRLAAGRYCACASETRP